MFFSLRVTSVQLSLYSQSPSISARLLFSASVFESGQFLWEGSGWLYGVAYPSVTELHWGLTLLPSFLELPASSQSMLLKRSFLWVSVNLTAGGYSPL